MCLIFRIIKGALSCKLFGAVQATGLVRSNDASLPLDLSNPLEAMFSHLKTLIKWSDRETCRTTMPQILKDLYPKERHHRLVFQCTDVYGLWTTSCFAFESMNGVVKGRYRGTRDMCIQVNALGVIIILPVVFILQMVENFNLSQLFSPTYEGSA